MASVKKSENSKIATKQNEIERGEVEQIRRKPEKNVQSRQTNTVTEPSKDKTRQDNTGVIDNGLKEHGYAHSANISVRTIVHKIGLSKQEPVHNITSKQGTSRIEKSDPKKEETTQFSRRMTSGDANPNTEDDSLKEAALLAQGTHDTKTYVSYWDCGGDDEYHATHHIHLSSDAVYIIPFDMTSMISDDGTYKYMFLSVILIVLFV